MVGKVAARSQAREGLAELVAQRREHERRLEAAAVGFFEADAALSQALQVVASAEAARLDALAEVMELGLSVGEVSALCGVDPADVRAARKHAHRRAAAAAVAGN